ncbi:MAG: peptidoglycan-binding protein [Pseudomonadota bacterium]
MSFWQNLLGLVLGRNAPSPPGHHEASTPEKPVSTKPVQAEQPVDPSRAPPAPTPAEPAPELTPVAQVSALIGKRVRDLISLGAVDAGVTEASVSTFITALERITRLPLSQVTDTLERFELRRLPTADEASLTVSQLQAGLRATGFFPGGEVDGICGYRTQAAIRLFQEHVRTMDGVSGMRPDGLYGAKTHEHLIRYLTEGLRMDWQQVAGEHELWVDFLSAMKAKYLTTPDAVTQAVNAFAHPSDTRKPQDWVTSAEGEIHLLGVRRSEFDGKFDDIFVLLIKGMVFKFQGSTEPGASSHSLGKPFLVQGQHVYNFGWHQSKYRALRPLHLQDGHGVLIIRAGADGQLGQDDLERGLEPNFTINIHWAGRGMARNVGNWSEGCQVITGTVYISPKGEIVRCDEFVGLNNSAVAGSASQTRGAYTLLADLVTALSGDMGTQRVNYTMITEDDLGSAPEIANRLQSARTRLMQIL